MTAIVIGRLTTFITYPQITFNPQPSNILDISNAQRAEVTTDGDHGLVDGTIVQFFVNSNYIMEINNYSSEITVTGDDTFLTNINTLQMSNFVIPDDAQSMPAQVVPFANTPVYNTYEQN